MRRIILMASIACVALITANCHSSKKLATVAPTPVTYATEMQTIVINHCSPCHIPEKGGNKKAYDNYANLKTDIDEIIRRIELDPTTRGFMPFKHPKLSDSTIAVFKQWKIDGLN